MCVKCRKGVRRGLLFAALSFGTSLVTSTSSIPPTHTYRPSKSGEDPSEGPSAPESHKMGRNGGNDKRKRREYPQFYVFTTHRRWIERIKGGILRGVCGYRHPDERCRRNRVETSTTVRGTPRCTVCGHHRSVLHLYRILGSVSLSSFTFEPNEGLYRRFHAP